MMRRVMDRMVVMHRLVMNRVMDRMMILRHREPGHGKEYERSQ